MQWLRAVIGANKVPAAFLLGAVMAMLYYAYLQLIELEESERIEAITARALNRSLLRDKIAREIGE